MQIQYSHIYIKTQSAGWDSFFCVSRAKKYLYLDIGYNPIYMFENLLFSDQVSS